MAGVAGVLIPHILLLIKLKFTAWPEMLAWPFLLTEGWLPYRDIAIAHTPILFTVLAGFFKLFGIGIIQLKIFTWVLIIFTDLLLYKVTLKLWNKKVALMSLAAYILPQVFYDGNGLWFDLALTPLGLILYYLVKTKKYFKTGITFALGLLTKQTFVWFLIPTLLSKIKYKRFILGGIVTSMVFTALLILFGIMPDFYNWTVNFGIFILPKAQGQVQFPDIKNLIVSISPFFIFIPLIYRKRKEALSLLSWAVAGSLGTYPRFEYFHFQPALPFLAIAIALLLSVLKKEDRVIKAFVILYILGSLYLFANFFMRNYQEGTRFFEKDVQNVSSYIKENTEEGDKIFVLNYWDSIYALSDTVPAVKPLVPQLSWYMDIPGVQEKMLEDLMTEKPSLIILNPYQQVGLASYRPQKVLEWVSANYKLKGKVDSIEILVQK